MTLDQRLEAMLFAAAKPFTAKRLAELVDEKKETVDEALEVLRTRLKDSESSLMLLSQGQEVELVTRPEVSEDVEKVIKQEERGELTRPALEALTILAYRGPLTRPELEQIRGVHSSIIIRNLMLRGLIESTAERLGQPVYAVTFDFLRHLGVSKQEELPEFAALHGNAAIADVLAELSASVTASVTQESLDV